MKRIGMVAVGVLCMSVECAFAAEDELAGTAFGAATEDVEFHPYWENGVKSNATHVKASYWRRKDGTRLYVISKLSPNDDIEAEVSHEGNELRASLPSFGYAFKEVK